MKATTSIKVPLTYRAGCELRCIHDDCLPVDAPANSTATATTTTTATATKTESKPPDNDGNNEYQMIEERPPTHRSALNSDKLDVSKSLKHHQNGIRHLCKAFHRMKIRNVKICKTIGSFF